MLHIILRSIQSITIHYDIVIKHMIQICTAAPSGVIAWTSLVPREEDDRLVPGHLVLP